MVVNGCGCARPSVSSVRRAEGAAGRAGSSSNDFFFVSQQSVQISLAVINQFCLNRLGEG